MVPPFRMAPMAELMAASAPAHSKAVPKPSFPKTRAAAAYRLSDLTSATARSPHRRATSSRKALTSVIRTFAPMARAT